MVGVLGALTAVVIGTLYGAISGYVGGRTDAIMTVPYTHLTPPTIYLV